MSVRIPSLRHPVALALLALGAATPWAEAQTPPAPPEPVSAAGMAAPHPGPAAPSLAPVTVRARHADEVLQELPFSITVIGGEEVEKRGLLNLEQAMWGTPGVEINSYGDSNSTMLRIRGVGTLQKTGPDDSSVTINIDGMPHGMESASSNLLDVEQIEVLKGPQGTMFGRNSEAGAINIRTRQPTREFEGSARLELGSDQQREAQAVLSGPVSETLSVRLAVGTGQQDSHLLDRQTRQPLATLRHQTVRGKLLWQPSAATSATLTLQHDENRGPAGTMLLRPYGNPPLLDTGGVPYRDRQDGDSAIAEIHHDLQGARLSWLSGHVRRDSAIQYAMYSPDLLRAMMPGLPFPARADNEIHSGTAARNWNHELRLASLPGADLFWVLGANHYRANRDARYQGRDGAVPQSGFNADITRQFSTRATALFGETTVPVSSRLKLTGGLRYTQERKTYAAQWQAAANNPSALRQATDQQALNQHYAMGRLAAHWKLTEQMGLYGVYGRGIKSAGFGADGTNIAYGGADAPYKAAKSNSFEVGLKGASADGRFGASVAAFFTDTRDDHLMAWNPLTGLSVTENADTRSKGLEVEGYARLGAGFSLRGGVGLTDAKVRSLPAHSNAPGAHVGARVPDSPRWNGTLAVEHQTALASFAGLASPRLQTRLSYRITGNRAATLRNDMVLPAYRKLDLRVAVVSGSSEFYLWAHNLLNERWDLFGYELPSAVPGAANIHGGTPARGRSLGVGFAHYF